MVQTDFTSVSQLVCCASITKAVLPHPCGTAAPGCVQWNNLNPPAVAQAWRRSCQIQLSEDCWARSAQRRLDRPIQNIAACVEGSNRPAGWPASTADLKSCPPV